MLIQVILHILSVSSGPLQSVDTSSVSHYPVCGKQRPKANCRLFIEDRFLLKARPSYCLGFEWADKQYELNSRVLDQLFWRLISDFICRLFFFLFFFSFFLLFLFFFFNKLSIGKKFICKVERLNVK